MRTTVVCGLLGSGKTTFIRNYVKKRTIEKTVVLVNDFGKMGIDGEIFSTGGIQSVELPSGCVCCTLKFDLITAIKKIVHEFAPDHLMIEPSGVASPSSVIEALESSGIASATVVGLIDATEFIELIDSGMYGGFFEDQISFADVILVNKVDLATEEVVAGTMKRIEAMNPRAILFRTIKAEIADDSINILRPALSIEEGISGPQKKKSGSHFHFETLSFKLGNETKHASFSDVVSDLAAGRHGAVARAKALVQTDEGPFQYDIVFGKVDRLPFAKEIQDSRIVIIGKGLDENAIRRTLIG